MGREIDAVRSLEGGLEIEPGNAGLLNQLGWLHATSDNPAVRDPGKALAYAMRAVEASNGSNPNLLDTLAECPHDRFGKDVALARIEADASEAPLLLLHHPDGHGIHW